MPGQTFHSTLAPVEPDYEFLWRDYVPAGLKRRPVAEIEATDIEATKVRR